MRRAAIVLAVGTLALAPFDESISAWLRAPERSGPVLEWVHGVLGMPTAVMLLLVIFTGFDNWRRVLPAIAVPLLAANILTEVVKRLVGRARPDQKLGAWTLEWNDGWAEAGMWQSFPSGHATAAAALAACLVLLLPRWRLFFIPWAVMVCLGRVLAQRHFLSDVLAGATIGIGCVLLYACWAGRGALRLDRTESAANRSDAHGRPDRRPSLRLVIIVMLGGFLAAGLAAPFDHHVSQALAGTSFDFEQPVRGVGDVAARVGMLLDALFGPALLFALLGRRRDWRFAYAFLLSAVIMTQIPTHLAKFAVGRARPNAEEVAGAFAFRPFDVDNLWQRWDSFPSGHSSHGVCVAFVLATLFPHARWWLWGLAAIYLFERVPSGWHWPSDVPAGALVGLVCAAWMRRMTRWQFPTDHHPSE